jgi:hypothetical protein
MSRRFLFLLFALLCLPTFALAQARVREYKKTIPTYPYSDPNPIPMIGKIYPYFRYDLYAAKPVPKDFPVEMLAMVVVSAIGLEFKEMFSPRRTEEHEKNPGKSSCSSFLRGELFFRLVARWTNR